MVAGAQYLTFDTLIFGEPAGGWDGVGGYTVDRPGLYLVHAQLFRPATATSSQIVVRLRKNGVSFDSVQTVALAAAMPGECTGLIHAEAGDLFQVNATVHATLPSSILATTAYFWGARIGPKRWTG